MIYTNMGSQVEITGKRGEAVDYPFLELVEVMFSDGLKRWRAVFQLRADDGLDEIIEAIEKAPVVDDASL